MSCSYANHNQTAIANVVDSGGDFAEKAQRIASGDAKFFKFGSVWTVGNIAAAAAQGEYYDAFRNIRNDYTGSMDKLTGKRFWTSCFDLGRANATRS